MATRKSVPKFYPPDRISVLSPRPSIYPRGTGSKEGKDPMKSIRFPDDMWEAVGEVADLLTMSRAELVRWSAFAVCNEVMRLAKASGVEIVSEPTERMIEKNARPRFERVLVVSDGGASVSHADVEPAIMKKQGIETKVARSIEQIMAERLKK